LKASNSGNLCRLFGEQKYREKHDLMRYYFSIKIAAHDIPIATNIHQNTAPPSSSSFPQGDSEIGGAGLTISDRNVFKRINLT